ncbi:hypothetical protein [Evansella clarkii]|uniref:hypothetical protein n=1 Tax=Evansella clarkii TaxID=79879 RepID=UPI000998795E|nr:hypothetical protein [Evansella clarkii]
MKKLIPFVLLVLLSAIFTNQTLASDADTLIIPMDHVDGEIIQNDAADNTYSLSQFVIQEENGEVNGDGLISINGQNFDLAFAGEIYPIDNGHYAENLVVGDIDSDDFNVLQFRVENMDNTTLSFVLEHKDNGEWISFEQEIDENTFERLYQSSVNFIEVEGYDHFELADKIIPLLNINNKSQFKDEVEITNETTSPETIIDDEGNNVVKEPEFSIYGTNPSESDNWEDINIRYDRLDQLFRDLKESPTNSINLEEKNFYGGIYVEDLFKGEGWKRWRAQSGTSYDYYAYSSEQGYNTLTQLSMIIPTGYHTGIDGEGIYHQHAVYEVLHGALVEYNELTKDLSVVYYNGGISFENFEIGISQFSHTSRNVFISSILDGQDLEQTNQPIRYFVSRLPHGERVIDLWEALTPYEVKELRTESFFGPNYDDQIDYNGTVVRAVSGNLGNNILRAENAHAKLTGIAHIPTGNLFFRPSNYYKTDVRTNLFVPE